MCMWSQMVYLTLWGGQPADADTFGLAGRLHAVSVRGVFVQPSQPHFAAGQTGSRGGAVVGLLPLPIREISPWGASIA